MKRTFVLLAVLASAGSLAACSSKHSKSSSGYSGSTKSAKSATTLKPKTAGTNPDAGANTVGVATKADLGDYLVGPNGHTLYLFEKDNGTTTACTGACASAWPALTASGQPSVGPGVDSSKLSTANGEAANQVVYNGHLLYYFSGDKAVGDTNGIGIPSWYPVAPSGDKIDKD